MINNCEKRILYWGLPHVVFLAIASILTEYSFWLNLEEQT